MRLRGREDEEEECEIRDKEKATFVMQSFTRHNSLSFFCHAVECARVWGIILYIFAGTSPLSSLLL